MGDVTSGARLNLESKQLGLNFVSVSEEIYLVTINLILQGRMLKMSDVNFTIGMELGEIKARLSSLETKGEDCGCKGNDSVRALTESERRCLEQFSAKKVEIVQGINALLAKFDLKTASGLPLYLESFKVSPLGECPDGQNMTCVCCQGGGFSCCCPPCTPRCR